MRIADYETAGFYDEIFDDGGQPRESSKLLLQTIESLPDGELQLRQLAAEKAFLQAGITFNVYGDEEGVEKIFPFDIIPRIVGAKEWAFIDLGLRQRITALNLFLQDIYSKQLIVKDGIIPEDVIQSAASFRQQCLDLSPPLGVWCHVTGTDLVRDENGVIFVLEDNMRCPSGVSYVLENREVMKQTFPGVFEGLGIRPVNEYPSRLLDMLEQIAPKGVDRPCVVVLTPGPANSAYFEHSYLAQQMGVQLVEGRDLVVMDGYVRMRTTQGFERVDVIYRRIDDDFLDPLAFRPDSYLGVPGLMEVYRAGRLGLANAPGTGVADDKAVYAYVPKMIDYYLRESPLLYNVPTYLCSDLKECEYVLENLDKLVVKSANEAGGYGMLVGPHSTKQEQSEFAVKIRSNPRNFIAQPTLSLSRVPSLINGSLQGRHVDLRPYILYGEDIFVLPGGLTRVALKSGSLVVNSSQGGGSKDTWVLNSG